MKTFEVRIREEDGSITTDFYVAADAEALYDYLRELNENLDVVGFNVVGG